MVKTLYTLEMPCNGLNMMCPEAKIRPASKRRPCLQLPSHWSGRGRLEVRPKYMVAY